MFNMMEKNARVVVGVALIAVAFGGPLGAVEVYQWTDENGVVHFSQWSPGEQVEEVATVHVDGGEAGNNGLGISEADDPEGYRAHREEMDALWSEIEERREAAHERSLAGPDTEIIYVDSGPDYAIPYYPPRFRPHPGTHPGSKPSPRPRPRPGDGDEPEPGTVRTVSLRRP